MEGFAGLPTADRPRPGAFLALDARRLGQPEALAGYERCFCRAEAIHASCEGHRASATIDLEHDCASGAAGEKIVDRLYDPLALWRGQCAGAVRGQAVEAGHFLAEELPDETAALVRTHLLR